MHKEVLTRCNITNQWILWYRPDLAACNGYELSGVSMEEYIIGTAQTEQEEQFITRIFCR